MRSVIADLASQPTRNLLANPQPASALRWYAIGPEASAPEPLAGGGLTTTWAGSSANRIGLEITLPAMVPVTPGRKYTMSCQGRSPQCGFGVTMLFRDAAQNTLHPPENTTGAVRKQGTVTSGTTWVDVPALTYTAPEGAAFLQVGLLVDYNLVPSAGTLDGRHFAVFESGTARPYGDGSTPGWRWTGTSDDSESVGYPYMLEKIAGQPMVSLTTPSVVNAPLPALQGRTLYVVNDVVDLSSTSARVAWYGSNSTTSRMQIGTHTEGTNLMRYRVDTENGAVNAVLSQPYRSVGRHVNVLQVNDGLTQMSCIADDSTLLAQPLIPGGGLIDPALELRASSVDIGIALLLYDRPHNEVTMRRVMAWLARRYGAPISSGF